MSWGVGVFCVASENCFEAIHALGLELQVIFHKGVMVLPSGINKASGLQCEARAELVVNLLGVALENRPAYFERLLPQLQELRARTGRPRPRGKAQLARTEPGALHASG
jgi:hypothetical protein